MSKREYTGVILAAGRGKRMFPFSEEYPKPLLPVCNKPVIQHQIEIMKELGLRDIVVLVGHKGFQISKVLGDGHRLGVTIRYAEQATMLGIAHAVGRLESHIHRPFLLFLGDIFLVPSRMEQMFDLLEEQGGGAVLGTKEEMDPEAIKLNYSVSLNADGFVTRVVEKPRHSLNRMKGVGVYLFDLPIFDAIRRTPRTAMRDEYEITDSIQVLIQDGYPVRPSNSVSEDINLTTPADLLRCNLKQMGNMVDDVLLGGNNSLHQQAHLHNCVLGAYATIRHPICVRDSLIFENTCVESTSDLSQHIVTPELLVDCSHGMQNGRFVHDR